MFGRVANISLGDDDTFYYDVDFTPGFGDRKESRILEWLLSENVKQYITTLSATPAPGAPHLEKGREEGHTEGVATPTQKLLPHLVELEGNHKDNKKNIAKLVSLNVTIQTSVVKLVGD